MTDDPRYRATVEPNIDPRRCMAINGPTSCTVPASASPCSHCGYSRCEHAREQARIERNDPRRYAPESLTDRITRWIDGVGFFALIALASFVLAAACAIALALAAGCVR